MPLSRKNPTAETRPRPDIYRYHDHRRFLADLIAHRKETGAGFTLRSLADEAGVATSYLSMVISGTRALSGDALEKIARPLGLTAAERTHLELLRLLGESDSQEVRASALERIQKQNAYQKTNPKENETFRYLSQWLNVAIREMVSLRGFRADAAWIVERLRKRPALRQAEEALKFLVDNGYIELAADGKASLPVKALDCVGGVFRLALGQFHRQMLKLAAEAYDNSEIDERNITGQTIAIAQEDWPKLRKILDDTLKKVGDLERNEKPKDAVYHITFAAFPLTKPTKA